MNNTVRTWIPAMLMAAGLVLVKGINSQRALALVQPLTGVIPSQLEGMTARDRLLSEEERIVAGVDNYLLRDYYIGDSLAVNLYVGYYESQTQGSTIHSPKNCMPGTGWDALASRSETIQAASRMVTVNRYVLQRENERVLVLYWYQGRGRVAANEYAVKWHLLRDAAIRNRTEEALVRLVVPITESEDAAFELAARLAGQLIPDIDGALPSI